MAQTQIRGNTQIMAGTITNTEISSTANIASTKIQVTADFDFQNFKGINLANPTNAQDAATKSYVDSLSNTQQMKEPVRVATTGNVTLSGGAPNSVDGVSLATGDRILVKDQTTGSENGIYTVQTLGTGANGTWVRASDADSSDEVKGGLTVWVNEGTNNGNKYFVLTTDDPITLGTTALTFEELNNATATALLRANNLSDLTNTATARSNLGVAIGSDVQAWDANLDQIAALSPTADYFIVGNGTQWTAESPSQARTSLGLGTMATQNANAVSITGGTISGITDLAIADGGTGASDAATARANLGLKELATRDFNKYEVTGDGTTTSWTLPNTPILESLQVFVQGILQKEGATDSYTVSGATVTFTWTPANGDQITFFYQY